jgi:hypothetical protein
VSFIFFSLAQREVVTNSVSCAPSFDRAKLLADARKKVERLSNSLAATSI